MNTQYKAFSRRAFTLLELLVAIAIIAFICALFLGAVSRMRLSMQNTKCINNQRQIVAGSLLYAADHDNRLPPFGNSTNHDFGRTWIVFVSAYLNLPIDQFVSVTAYRCPRADPESFNAYGVNYGWQGNTPFGYENELGSCKVNQIPSSAMICADGAPGGYIYAPFVYPLNASESEDYLSGKMPDASYNYMNFRHDGHAICGKVDGSVISITVKEWVDNAGNIWGESRN